MNEPLFTPGPWKANQQTVTKSNGLKITVKSPSAAAPEAWDEIGSCLQADARLIAAAPEMYELLQRFLNYEGDIESDVRALLTRINPTP